MDSLIQLPDGCHLRFAAFGAPDPTHAVATTGHPYDAMPLQRVTPQRQRTLLLTPATCYETPAWTDARWDCLATDAAHVVTVGR